MARTYTATDGTAVVWRDSKRYLWVLGLVVPLAPLVGLWLHAITGMGVWLWLLPILYYAVIPLIDLFAGKDSSNPPEEIVASLEQDRYYRAVVFAYIPVQYIGFLLGMYFLATQDLSTIDRFGLCVSVGLVAGVAINTAHELGHKREEVERWASKIALAQSFYGHFFIEHNRGHHVRVATHPDPASARMGESFYRFWPRTVWGSLTSAWELEANRYKRKGQHPFRIGNHVLNAWLMSLALWGGLTAFIYSGVAAPPVISLPMFLGYLVLQGFIGFTLLEVVNYMEHYGMLRQMIGPVDKQRYERVTPAHSWNSNNIATNVLLYHLQRHSDHHANPTRRYQALRDFKEAPVLPTGYTGMTMVAYIPFWFRALMDKRVYDHYDGDITLANLAPHKREKLLKKYPPKEHAEIDPAPHAGGASSVDPTAQQFVGLIEAARCPGCGYTYSVEIGDEAEGFKPGTAWADIPDAWCCPDCGVREKVDFVPLTKQEV